MEYNRLLGIKVGNQTISEMFDDIVEFLKKPTGTPFHICNLNPDIFILALNNKKLARIINSSHSVLIDGVGIKLTSHLFNIKSGERLNGTDFMFKLIEFAAENKKKVLLLGGKDNTAELASINIKSQFPDLIIKYDQGAVKIESEKSGENRTVIKLINKFKPDILFVAYGPPYQELWIDKNKKKLKGIVCMGVGGAFNFYAKKTIRAPYFIRKIGLEWVWRFIFEPQRLLTKLPNYFIFVKFILINFFKKNENTYTF